MDFTHVINPYSAPAGSDAERSQRITFAALTRATEEARCHGIEVEVLGVTLPADENAVLPPARAVPLLTRCIGDVAATASKPPLPLCGDVLNLGAAHGTGRYLIFTNMDICPQPYFYRAIARLLADEPDLPLVIPRRTIPARFQADAPLDEMYAEIGVPHEGFDCFVFPREWTSKLDLRHLCLGMPSFDLVLILNFEFLNHFRTRILWGQFLTFHLGDDKAWKTAKELMDFNLAEACAIGDSLAAKLGSIPRRSHFVYAGVWLYQTPPPAAPFLLRAVRRFQQRLAEWRARWLIRPLRRAAGLPGW